MNTMYFEISENVCFKPLLWLRSIYHLVEIYFNVCWLLWNISLLWRLHYHLFLDTFDIVQHDTLSCSSTCFLEIMSFHGELHLK